MKRKTIQSKLYLLIAFIALIIIVVPLNYYLNYVADHAMHNLHRTLETEKDLSDIFLLERDSLANSSKYDELSGKYSRLRKSISAFHTGSLVGLLNDRQQNFEKLHEANGHAYNLYIQVHHTLIELMDSAKKIHNSHAASFNTQLNTGQEGQKHNASETNIISAAAIVQSSLFDIAHCFYDLQMEDEPEGIGGRFENAMKTFADSANDLNNYPISPQEGGLVKQMLRESEEFNKQFALLTGIEHRKYDLLSRVDSNRQHIHASIIDTKGGLEKFCRKIAKTIHVLQSLILVLALLFSSMAFIYGKRIIRQIRRTVTETHKIDNDLTYQIEPAPDTYEEFGIVFDSLNSMARKNHINIQKLQKAQEEMEQRIRDRTVELLEANRRLRREIEERIRSDQEKESLQTMLQQAQKMEAMGTLAGGIAHDFNNILTAILGYAAIALVEIEGNCKARADIQEVIKAGERAKNLVRQILTFSRQTDQDIRPLSVQPILKETLKLLRASIPTTIEIQLQIDPACGNILADPTHIHQVIMNLCSNAAQAMEEKGGTMTVELKPVRIEEGDQAASLHLPAGPYVRLTVSDTGCGMDAATIGRIFEPFFTTKGMGKGTGMGLAVVHGIVESIGGRIKVESAPGQGATFHIYLPETEEEASTIITHSALQSLGDASILLVEDEEQVARMAKRSLSLNGYTVTVSRDGGEALSVFRAQPDKFDLVITDQTMPKMTGTDLAEEILRIRPGLPIILCSGYSSMLSEEKIKSSGIREFITKPYTGGELSAIIHRVLTQS